MMCLALRSAGTHGHRRGCSPMAARGEWQRLDRADAGTPGSLADPLRHAFDADTAAARPRERKCRDDESSASNRSTSMPGFDRRASTECAASALCRRREPPQGQAVPAMSPIPATPHAVKVRCGRRRAAPRRCAPGGDQSRNTPDASVVSTPMASANAITVPSISMVPRQGYRPEGVRSALAGARPG